MKTLPWFRMYHEAIDDEKLRLLAFEDRWHFVAILCLKCKGLLDAEQDFELLQQKVALKLGLTLNELENVVKRLARMGLICPDTYQPLAWGDRQMQSDKDETNAQRQQRFRAAHKKPVTGGNALRNGEVTRIDTDTDKDKETDMRDLKPKSKPKAKAKTKQIGLAEGFDSFFEAYGKRVSRVKAEQAWEKINPDSELTHLIVLKAASYAGSITDRQFQKDPTTWLNGKCWNDDIKGYSSKPSQPREVYF